MASHQLLLLIFLVAFSSVEARESVFFSKVNPVRRYSQFLSSPIAAFAPSASPVSAAPAPAPSSEIEPSASENYVYGLTDQEVGEFPLATAKVDSTDAVWKTSRDGDDFVNQQQQHYNNRYTNYDDQYSTSNNYEEEVNQEPGFQRSYSSSNNLPNYKYTRSYDDSNMYNEVDNNDQYTNEKYYTDKFERVKPKTIGGTRYGRYYNDNGEGYYRDNESTKDYNNSMEEYEGAYQP